MLPGGTDWAPPSHGSLYISLPITGAAAEFPVQEELCPVHAAFPEWKVGQTNVGLKKCLLARRFSVSVFEPLVLGHPPPTHTHRNPAPTVGTNKSHPESCDP